jgi:hypothetical protein
MTTALIISELIPLYDDALVADIDAAFAEIDREIALANELAEQSALLLDVEWLMDELLEDTIRVAREGLEISLELRNDDLAHVRDEVAKVA